MKFTHRAQVIEVDYNGKFRVHIDDVDDVYATLEEAKAAIDRWRKTQASAVKLELPISYEADGVWRRDTLIGIHRGTSELRLTGRSDHRWGYGVKTVCPPSAWVEQAKALMRDLSELLKAVEIPIRQGYGRIEAEKYDGLVAELQRRYEQAMTFAEGEGLERFEALLATAGATNTSASRRRGLSDESTSDSC